MAEQPSVIGMARKLAAIFSTDVVGYSRLMGDDEEATIRTLTTYRELISSLIQQYRGRVVDSPGDNLLAEFASVVDAVRCAVEIQEALKTKNAELPEQRQMRFRIGINLGDVIVEGERLYGDGVNIAARMESLAVPGGICISGTVHDHVKNKLALSYDDLGPQQVKNIAEPVRVYRIRDGESSSYKSSSPQPHSPEAAERNLGTPASPGLRAAPSRLLCLRIAAGLVLLAATAVIVRHFSLSSPSTQPPTPSTQAAPPLLPLPDKPSIIVLPFMNMSKDPDQDYFSDGLTETLTGDLSKISSLFVIARNSAFTYKGKAVKVQDVGREMGVRYVLEGSVQKAAQRVRITTQLIDTTTGYHVWSEQYDRPLTDIFALQDEIVQKIVFALQVKLTLEEQERFRHFPTDNLEAYDFFLRAWELWWRFTKEANLQSRHLLEKAIELDPKYAGAYAQLGFTYWTEWVFHWSQKPQPLERAFELAQKARALDGSLPDPHFLLSFTYLRWQKQPKQALAEAERAIALDPNYADSYYVLADVLSNVGRPEEAIGVAEKAVRLNPRYPASYLWQMGYAYRLTGRVGEAIVTQKQVLAHDSNFQPAYAELAWSYVLEWGWQLSPDSQTLEHAFTAVQKILTVNDFLPWAHNVLGRIYLWQKRSEQARVEAERAIALEPNVADGYATLAEVLSFAGRPEEAIGWAEKAMHVGFPDPHLHLFQLGQAYYLSGRPEEAIAPLKQYLTRYPNILGAHLTLAAVYSESGQAAEAQAEAAEVLRLNPNFSLEIHKQRMPIKDPAVLERHIAALRKAGLK